MSIQIPLSLDKQSKSEVETVKKKNSPSKRKSNFGPYTTFDSAFEQGKKLMKGFDEVKDADHYTSKRIHTELN